MITLTLSITAILAILVGIVIIVWPKVVSYALGIWLLLYGLLQIVGIN